MDRIELDDLNDFNDPDALRPGTVLLAGRYTIEHQLGRGGTATVYVARCTDGTEVAMKIMGTKRAGDADQEQRFVNEAEIVAKIGEHPGLVRTREVGHVPELDGRLYMTMDLVLGPTLSLSIISGALPALHACEIMRDVADTVAYLHGRGVIHRDIKPSNIMLPKTGSARPRLLDFGYAISFGQDDLPSTAGLTQVHQRPGTKHYMSPEQALGEPPTPAFDVYALGATLYEALIGQPPFFSLSPDDAVRRKVDPKRPEVSIAGRRADLPEALERLVDEALRRDAKHRLASATHFRDRLAEIVRELEVVGATPAPRFIDASDERRDHDVTLMMGSPARSPRVDLEPLQPIAGETLVASGGTEFSLAPQPGATEISIEPPPRAADEITKPEAAASNPKSTKPTPPPPALRSSGTLVDPVVRQVPTMPGAPPTDPDAVAVVDPSRKWVGLAIAGLLAVTVGVGAYLLREDQPREFPSTEPRPETITPPAPRAAEREPQTPAAHEPSRLQPAPDVVTPTPVEPTPVEPSPVEAEPKKPLAPKPGSPAEPAKREPKSAASQRPPTGAEKVPAAKTPACEEHRATAKQAATDLDWARVLQLSKRNECWPDGDKPQALKIEALYELGRVQECAAAAKSRTPASVQSIAARCLAQAK